MSFNRQGSCQYSHQHGTYRETMASDLEAADCGNSEVPEGVSQTGTFFSPVLIARDADFLVGHDSQSNAATDSGSTTSVTTEEASSVGSDFEPPSPSPSCLPPRADTPIPRAVAPQLCSPSEPPSAPESVPLAPGGWTSELADENWEFYRFVPAPLVANEPPLPSARVVDVQAWTCAFLLEHGRGWVSLEAARRKAEQFVHTGESLYRLSMNALVKEFGQRLGWEMYVLVQRDDLYLQRFDIAKERYIKQYHGGDRR